MKLRNLFKVYHHAYNPYYINGKEVFEIKLLTPVQAFFYDLRYYGLEVARENFSEIMKR